ncbi:MAG: hypothetical protein ABIQ62_07360 [Thermomonas sp.]
MKSLLLWTLLVTGIGLGVSVAAAQTSKAIVPGKVRAAAGTISATFKVIESKDGIQSTGTGGACLVANLSGRECHTDDDCRDLRTAYHPDGWAYCLQPKSSIGAKACWIRPGRQADYCRVSPVSPYPLGAEISLPRVDGAPRHDDTPVRWLIHGCLARYDPAAGKDHPGCKLSDPATMKTWNGKATTVQP